METHAKPHISIIQGRCFECGLFALHIVRVRKPNGTVVKKCIACKNKSQESRADRDSRKV